MALTSGNTLSLAGLGQATGQLTTNISLGTIEGTPTAGENISMSSFALGGSGVTAGSVGSISGYTYAVENTSETYTLGFNDAGTRFAAKISSRQENFDWYVSLGTGITFASKSGATATFSVNNMTNVPTQTVLQQVAVNEIGAKFVDGFNDHASGYNTYRYKGVYSVDSYDGNSAALCLTIDSPVTLADGTIVEAGDLNEGDKLKGFSIGGLGTNSDETFLDWSSDSLSTTPKDVTIVNLTYSFASRYYDVNNGEITATSEHPMLVKDSVSGNYVFKEMFNLVIGDKLIKGDGTEVDITSIDIIQKTSEIVSIDVEEEDTYMVNGYITHNKGGNSFTQFEGPAAPTSVTYSSPLITWVAPTNTTTTGVTAYEWHASLSNDFNGIFDQETEWSTTEVEVDTILGPGQWYFRVRAIEAGLKGVWSSTLSFIVPL